MFKKISLKIEQRVSLRVQRIFFGSTFVSAAKIAVTFLILYLLANAAEGSMTAYGNYQNIITILMAVVGLSVQNGVTNYTAKSDIKGTKSSLTPHLLSIFMIGLAALSVITAIAYVWDLDFVSNLIGFSEGNFRFSLLIFISILGVLQSYYCAALIGKGLVVQGQVFDLLRNLLFVIFIAAYICWHKDLNLIGFFVVSHLIIVPFLLRQVTLNPSLEFKPKFDAATIRIIKPGMVTMYSGIMVASVSILVRNTAVDYGGYVLSDLFEILIRIKVMYHLVVSAPLSLILLRSYAVADASKTFHLAYKALPIVVVPMLCVALTPESVLQSLLLLAFNKELGDLKFVLLLLLGAESVRVIALFFHNFLVSKAIVIPQVLFGTLSQIIIVAVVLKFSSVETFIINYFWGYLLSQVIWLVLNYVFVRSIIKRGAAITSS